MLYCVRPESTVLVDHVIQIYVCDIFGYCTV